MKIIIPVSLQLMQDLIKMPADINYDVNSVFFQEEQHSGSSANYDVEILHSAEVHMEQTVASENLEMTSSLVRNDIMLLALVVQKMDSTINQTNHYPLDKYQETRLCYPVDRDLSNRQPYPPFEPLGPDHLNKSDFFGIAIPFIHMIQTGIRFSFIIICFILF